jgi:hypothetical protein
LFVRRKQVKEASGPGFPINGKNSAVAENFQGSRRGGGKLPIDLILPMSIFLAAALFEYSVIIYLMLKTKSVLTIVDKSGIDHDE